MKKVIPLIILVSLFLKCTLVTEPERKYNSDAHPPEVATYNYSELTPGQKVDGTIKIIFDIPHPDFQISKISASVDNEYQKSLPGLPSSLILNTRNYEEGEHTIYFNIFDANPQHGTLNLLEVPSLVFDLQLYFDRTPADTVELNISSSKEKEIQLSWSKSKSEVFFAYLIYKSVNNKPFVLIDTINNRNITKYEDNAGLELYGTSYNYKVAVSKDSELLYQSQSNTVSYSFGNNILYNYRQLSYGPYLNEPFSQIYFIADNKFLIFSTIDNTLLKEINLDGFMDINYSVSFFLNKEKTKIYLYSNLGNKLWILNSSDFSISSKTVLPCNGYLAYFLDDSHLVLRNEEGFNIINIYSNKIERTIKHVEGISIYNTLPDEEGLNLYIITDQKNEIRLELLDLSDSNFTIKKSVSRYYIPSHMWMKDKSLFLAYWEDVEIYNSNTFEWIHTIYGVGNYYCSSFSDEAIAFLIRGKYSIPNLYEIECNTISIFNNNYDLIYNISLESGYRLALGRNKVFLSYPTINQEPKSIIGYSVSLENK